MANHVLESIFTRIKDNTLSRYGIDGGKKTERNAISLSIQCAIFLLEMVID